MTPTVMPPRRRPSREDVRLGLLISFVVSCAVVGLGAFLVGRWFEPEGWLFGPPTHIAACGRDYMRGTGGTWTRAQVDESLAPGLTPTVFEPVIGEIPLFAPLSGTRDFNGFQVCDTVVFLHVGPDAYEAFAMQGGP